MKPYDRDFIAGQLEAARENRDRAADCTPACPWCRTAKHVQTSAANLHAYYCRKCGRELERSHTGRPIGG